VLPDLFFWSNDDAFRKKFPEMAQRHDLYRSMTSERARASVDWEAIKLNLGEAAGVASFASELLPKARGTAPAQAIGNSPSGVLLFFDF